MGAQLDSTNRRPLKVGLILPETERQMNGGSARWSDLHQMAQLGEQIGADSLWITDHLIHRVPGEEPRGMWECWSLISALAAITKKPEIGTLVMSTSFRNPEFTGQDGRHGRRDQRRPPHSRARRRLE